MCSIQLPLHKLCLLDIKYLQGHVLPSVTMLVCLFLFSILFNKLLKGDSSYLGWDIKLCFTVITFVTSGDSNRAFSRHGGGKSCWSTRQRSHITKSHVQKNMQKNFQNKTNITLLRYIVCTCKFKEQNQIVLTFLLGVFIFLFIFFHL